MNEVIIYHNPRCSKSRQALALIKEKGLHLKVIEYLKTPLTLAQLQRIIRQLKCSPREIIRNNEPAYKSNQLQDLNLSDTKLLQAIVDYPILLQRPIVIYKEKAVIGRPPENVLDIL